MNINLFFQSPSFSALKEINPEYSLVGLMLKLQYFGHLMWRTDSFVKDPGDGKDWGQEKGATKDETVGGHYRLNGYELEQALGDGEGQGSLACCSPRGRKEWDVTGHWTAAFKVITNMVQCMLAEPHHILMWCCITQEAWVSSMFARVSPGVCFWLV